MEKIEGKMISDEKRREFESMALLEDRVPTEAGYYWVQPLRENEEGKWVKSGKREIVMVSEWAGGGLVVFRYGRKEVNILREFVEWSDRIEA